MKISTRIIIILICSVSVVVSHDVNVGSFAGVLDRMGAGVAELGAGNTGSCRADAMPGAYWNPALIGFQKQTLIAAGADMRSLNRNGGTIGIQGKVAPNMGLGLGMVNRGDYNVKVWDENENLLGTARPQDIGMYLGIGLKTTRKNSFGAALQWYVSNMDLGGQGDISQIGIINLGWYHVWFKNFKTALVVRNLGMNKRLSADYDFIAGFGETAAGLDQAGVDFFPKTFIAAAMFTLPILRKTIDVYGELVDYQLTNEFYDEDWDHHAKDFRLGAEWRFHPTAVARTGYDRGNFSFGFGYHFKLKNGKTLIFDYALLLESFGVTFNPYAIGFRYAL
ncbi:MAG: hypothetical protein HQK83_10440 [Fibrobacteria bacterium]|nr:hypothetical protein [Fibrobacteria bacterium]